VTVEKLVIVPTYNERDNIEVLLDRLLALPYGLDVLVVDDNSPDGTWELVERRKANEPRIHLLKRAGKLGLGSAYVAGFRYALSQGAQYVFEMDADFSHDPNSIGDFLKAIDGHDVVLGSRYLDGVTVVHWPLSPAHPVVLGECLHPHHHGPAGPGRDGRLQVLPAPGPRSGEPRPGQIGRLCLPDRNELQVLAKRVQNQGDPDHVRRPPGRRLEDEPEDRVGGRMDGVAASHHGSAGTDRPLDHTPVTRGRPPAHGDLCMTRTLLVLLAVLSAAPAWAARWDTYNNANNLNSVRAVSGTVWAASDYGLHRFDPGPARFTRVAKANGALASNAIVEVETDGTGTWFATRGRGVSVELANGAWRTLTTFDGLPSDTVTALEPASNGCGSARAGASRCSTASRSPRCGRTA
jgi:hypothetical protein